MFIAKNRVPVFQVVRSSSSGNFRMYVWCMHCLKEDEVRVGWKNIWLEDRKGFMMSTKDVENPLDLCCDVLKGRTLKMATIPPLADHPLHIWSTER